MNVAPDIPPDLLALMQEIGPRWSQDLPRHVELMVQQFTALVSKAPKDGVNVVRDIAYGSHERQRVDCFLPTNGPPQKRPALLYVHGGAFISGEKNRTSELYSNVLYYFARHGMVGVNIGYRLAPDATYPEASRDVGSAVRLVHANAKEWNIDTSRVFLMGHSAGGAHVASYAYDSRHHPAEGPGLKGLVVVSGRVRADNLPQNPNARKVEAYYGSAFDRYDDYSPVTKVTANSVPTMIAVAEFENPLLDVYCYELAYRLAAAKGKAPRLIRIKGHNHTSMMAHFNTADERLGREILEFIANPE